MWQIRCWLTLTSIITHQTSTQPVKAENVWEYFNRVTRSLLEPVQNTWSFRKIVHRDEIMICFYTARNPRESFPWTRRVDPTNANGVGSFWVWLQTRHSFTTRSRSLSSLFGPCSNSRPLQFPFKIPSPPKVKALKSSFDKYPNAEYVVPSVVRAVMFWMIPIVYAPPRSILFAPVFIAY